METYIKQFDHTVFISTLWGPGFILRALCSDTSSTSFIEGPVQNYVR